MPLFSTPTFAPLEGFPIVPDCYLSRFSSKDSVTSHFQVFFLHSVHRRRRRGAGSQCHHFPNFNGRLRVPLAHLRLLARALLGFRRIPEVANCWGSDFCLSVTGAACRVVSILGLLCSRASSRVAIVVITLDAPSPQHPGYPSRSPVETSPRSAHPSAPHALHYYAESWPSVFK